MVLPKHNIDAAVIAVCVSDFIDEKASFVGCAVRTDCLYQHT